jgi:hypothetical protein
MNNIVILLAAIATLFIGFVQCCNPEDMAIFVLACLVCVPAIIVSIVGIVIDKNFFEM